MGVVFSAITWLVAKIFGDNVLRFLAGKVLLTTLFVVVLPLVLNNLIADLLQVGLDLVRENMNDTGGIAGTLDISGAAGWIASTFKITECFSVIISALTLRLCLRQIPFLRF